MIDLLPRLCFGDNLRPSQVTLKLREQLADREKRTRNQLLLAISGLMFLVSFALFSRVSEDVRAFVPWVTIFGMLTSIWAVSIGTVLLIYARRIRFLRQAQVTAAAVMDKEVTSLWPLGAGGRSSWTDSPRNIREALNQSDDGTDQDVPHIITVRLRFVPGSPDANFDWPVLRDEVPHFDVTKRLRGGWGTFMGELRQGALVTLLYSPENPQRCRIIQRFTSHKRLAEE